MTEDTPRHRARTPSVEDIRVKAFPIPVYIAAGEVANTCMRVCYIQKAQQWEMSIRRETADTARKRKPTHFNAVNGEHHGMLCDTSLEEKIVSVSNHLG